MKKLLLALLLLIPTTLLAQQGTFSNPSGGDIGVATANCSSARGCVWQKLPGNAATTAIGVFGTFNETLLVEESVDGGVNWVTVATITTPGNSTFATSGFSDIRVRCSVFTSGIANVTINTGLLQVQSVVTTVTGGGGGVGPITTAFYASPNCTGPNCSFVNANTHWVCDATTTNTSNIVTAPDGNFLVTAKVGQTVWAVSATCNGGTGPLAIIETTILSVDSATQIRTVANATATNTATATLMWGTLDTPTAGNCVAGTDNVKTAWNAAGAIGATLYLPSGSGTVTTAGAGGIMVECSEFQEPTSTTVTSPTNLIGHVNSYIIATPNFDFTSIPGGNTGALGTFTATTSMIPNVVILRDVAFMCGGFNTWGTGNTHAIIFGQRIVATNVTGWGCGPTGISSGFSVTGPSTVVAGMFYNFGQTTCTSLGVGQNQTVVFTGTGYCSGPVALTLSNPGNWTISYGNFYQSFGGQSTINLGAASQVFNSFGDIIECENNNNTICVRNTASGSKVSLFGSFVYSTTEAAAAFGLIFNGAGAQTSAQGSTIQGAGGALISGAGVTGLFNDLGANTLTGGTICAASACTVTGSLSIRGVLATSNIGLTSGWGASTVATAVGDSHRGRFTITGAAGAATPTLTLTFPAPYFVAPASCQLIETGANDLASLTNPVSAAASTSSVLFTLTGTPVAVTYQFDYDCGPA